MHLNRATLIRWITAPTSVDVTVIFLVGLLPLTWFRGLIIAGGDTPWTLIAPHQMLREALSAWQSSIGLGHPSSFVRFLAYGITGTALEGLGFSLLGIARLLFVFWFAGAGLSTYFLMRVLLPRQRLASVIAALFYMLNPYTMTIRWFELTFWNFFYALIPLLLGLFVLGLREKTHRFRYIAAFLLVCMFASPSFANPGAVVMLALILVLYLCIHILQNRRESQQVRHALSYSALVAALFLATNLWWILPLPSSLDWEAAVLETPEGTLQRIKVTSWDSSWLRVLRLRGYWVFHAKHPGTPDPMIRYAEIYDRLPGRLGWLVPALGAVGLWSVRRRPTMLWAVVLLIGGSFFMKGLQPPFAGVTEWLYRNVYLMNLFRHPWEKFGMFVVLGLAPLVGMGMDGALRLTRWSLAQLGLPGDWAGGLVVGVLSTMLVGVIPWPMWTGDVIADKGQIIPSYRVQVPPEYEVARNWLQGQTEEFRILPLPLKETIWSASVVDWYWGWEPTADLLDSNLAAPANFRGGLLAQTAAKGLLAGDPGVTGQLNLINAKYVLLHGDSNFPLLGADWWGAPVFLPKEQMEAALAGQSALEFAAQFGRLTFYRNRDWRPLAAYATDRYVLQGDPLGGPRAGVLVQPPDASRLALPDALGRGDSAPLYSAQRLSPWRTRVRVTSQSAFFVILSEAYDDGWQVYRGSPNWLQTLLSPAEPRAKHFLANGYANGWYFEEPGDYELTLFYSPQCMLYLGLLGSAAAWLFVAIRCFRAAAMGTAAVARIGTFVGRVWGHS